MSRHSVIVMVKTPLGEGDVNLVESVRVIGVTHPTLSRPANGLGERVWRLVHRAGDIDHTKALPLDSEQGRGFPGAHNLWPSLRPPSPRAPLTRHGRPTLTLPGEILAQWRNDVAGIFLDRFLARGERGE